MSYDPLSAVIDESLIISDDTLDQLQAFRMAVKFTDLPGVNTSEEQDRLSLVFNGLLDRLINGISANPNKLWVMEQFQTALESIHMEDTEGRESFGGHLEKVMDILNIESSDGLLMFYL